MWFEVQWFDSKERLRSVKFPPGTPKNAVEVFICQMGHEARETDPEVSKVRGFSVQMIREVTPL